MSSERSPFLDACRGCNQQRLPVWIMRQAGRYLPEYQEVRKRVSFQQLCRTPGLVAEVVKAPVERFDLDAAILFSDILTMLEPMGAEVSFPNDGPHIARPVRSAEDVKQLHAIDPSRDLGFVFEAIRRTRIALPETPLIGFAGSPFTLACYLIEGGSSKFYNRARRFLHQERKAAEELIDLLTDMVGLYLRAQVDAGAQAVQVFESTGGVLSHDDFARFVIPPARRILGQLDARKAPRIIFVNNVAPYLDLVRDVECEVIGVDYRLPLAAAMKALPNHAIQGNFNPSALFGAPGSVVRGVNDMLKGVTDFDRLIVNLGHGIQPETPVDAVAAMVEAAHHYRKQHEFTIR